MRAFQASYYEAQCSPGPPGDTPSKLYRDSAGRIRIDRYVKIDAQPFCVMRQIYEPVSNTMFVLNDARKRVLKICHSPGQTPSIIGNFFIRNARADSASEDLGHKEIEGLVCRGHRIGEAEFWFSDELGIPILAREGEETRMRICDIQLTEPDPDLFTIPEDYEIVEERAGRS